MRLLIVSFTLWAAAAVADPRVGALLAAPGGRYVFGQVSDYRRDQYLLDTQTGRLWEIACAEEAADGKGCNVQILQEVRYLGGGAWSSVPLPSQSGGGFSAPERSKVPATPTAPPAPVGVLKLDSSPWATVYVDDELVDSTPMRPLSLPVGKHHVRLVNDDVGAAIDLDVMIEKGKTFERTITIPVPAPTTPPKPSAGRVIASPPTAGAGDPASTHR